MSYLERAITDGHAKLTGDGKQQAVPAPNGGRAQAPDRTPSDRADLVVFRDDERKKPYAVIECKADGVTDAEFNQAVEQACGNGTWAKFRANYVGVVAGMTRRFFDFATATLRRQGGHDALVARIYGQRNFSLSASTGERAGVRCRSPQFPNPAEI